MRALLTALLRHFLTPPGLIFLGALDSSLIFFLPLGIDFAVIVLSARKPDLFWMYALLATAGSVIGAAGTFWIGRKIGEHGLTRLVSPSRLRRVKARLKKGAAVSVGTHVHSRPSTSVTVRFAIPTSVWSCMNPHGAGWDES